MPLKKPASPPKPAMAPKAFEKAEGTKELEARLLSERKLRDRAVQVRKPTP